MTTRRRVGEQIGRLSYSLRSASMRFETHDSASMLFRHVDIDLAAYPMLAWRWYIELPIQARSTNARAKGTIARRGCFSGS